MPPSYTSSRTLNPLLVEEGYKGFNIVAYMGKFYAVAQSLGRIDFSDINIEDLLQGYRDKSQCFVGRSIFEAKHLLDKHRIEALQGEIAEIEDKEANIVK
jgi:hypothetical protein